MRCKGQVTKCWYLPNRDDNRLFKISCLWVLLNPVYILGIKWGHILVFVFKQLRHIEKQNQDQKSERLEWWSMTEYVQKGKQSCLLAPLLLSDYLPWSKSFTMMNSPNNKPIWKTCLILTLSVSECDSFGSLTDKPLLRSSLGQNNRLTQL